MKSTIQYADDLVIELQAAFSQIPLPDDAKARLEAIVATATQVRDFLTEAYDRAQLDRPFLWVRRVTNATAGAMSMVSALTTLQNLIGSEHLAARERLKDFEVHARELHARILAEPRPVVPGVPTDSIASVPQAAEDVREPAPKEVSAPPVVAPVEVAATVAEAVQSVVVDEPAPVNAVETAIADPVSAYTTPAEVAQSPISPVEVADVAVEVPETVYPEPSIVNAAPETTPAAVTASPTQPDEPVDVEPVSVTIKAPPVVPVYAAPEPKTAPIPVVEPTIPSPAIVPPVIERRPQPMVAETQTRVVGNTVALGKTDKPKLTLAEWDGSETIDDIDTTTASPNDVLASQPAPRSKRAPIAIPRPVLVKPKPQTLTKVVVVALILILAGVLAYPPIQQHLNKTHGDMLGARLVKMNDKLHADQASLVATEKQISSLTGKLVLAQADMHAYDSALTPQRNVKSTIADLQYKIATISADNDKLLPDVQHSPSGKHDEFWKELSDKYTANQAQIAALSRQVQSLQRSSERLAPSMQVLTQLTVSQQMVEKLRGDIRKAKLDRQVLTASIAEQEQYIAQLRVERAAAYHPK
ncbi:MAG TPA: hypothetical protein VGK19_07945 [Capsulimonadaceae bacterium]|jgi:hypothetical protein